MLALVMCDSVRFTDAVGRSNILQALSLPLFTPPFSGEVLGWEENPEWQFYLPAGN
ncbi:MAG: hypothetical protein LDL41_00040 [Coleofasciculus sp. S288]|nr:hypothetical protein [Coleofasciculus sp. S288]